MPLNNRNCINEMLKSSDDSALFFVVELTVSYSVDCRDNTVCVEYSVSSR